MENIFHFSLKALRKIIGYTSLSYKPEMLSLTLQSPNEASEYIYIGYLIPTSLAWWQDMAAQNFSQSAISWEFCLKSILGGNLLQESNSNGGGIGKVSINYKNILVFSLSQLLTSPSFVD